MKKQCFSTNNDFPAEFLKNLSLRILQENKTTELRITCEQCRKASLACSLCNFQNSDVSIQEAATWNQMTKNIFPVELENGQMALMVRHLFKDDPQKLYHPRLSNHRAALQNSMKLWMRLKKSGNLKEFIEVIKKESELGFQEKIKMDTDKDLPVFYSSVNYSIHPRKKSVRFVHNHSFGQHPSGAINESSLIPPNVCGNPVSILLRFHTAPHALTLDLKHAFKSLRTDPISNNLRRFFFTDIYDENKTIIREEDMMIFRPTVLSFGSALSSPFLDLARIMFVSKKVEYPESQKCIINNFYVDDACLLSDCKEKLDKIYKDVNQAFTYYNFIVKPPMISYQKEKQIDNFLANQWHVGENGEIDHVRPSIRYSLFQPKRNVVHDEINYENINEVILTKKVASRMLGLIFSYLHAQLLPLLAGAKILFAEISRICNDWNKPIKDVDQNLHKIFFQFAKNIINVEKRLNLVPRTAIPAGSKLKKIFCSVDSGLYLMAATVHLLTENDDGSKQCRILYANNKCHRLSIPKGEIGSHRIGVNLLKTILQAVDLSNHTFDIFLLTDSTASTYIYDPKHIYKCILSRNAASLVTTFINTTLGQHKNIKRFSLGYISGLKNPADKGSKLFNNPVEIANSKILLNGPDEFLENNYPKENNIFYTLNQGSTTPVYNALKPEGREEKEENDENVIELKTEKVEKVKSAKKKSLKRNSGIKNKIEDNKKMKPQSIQKRKRTEIYSIQTSKINRNPYICSTEENCCDYCFKQQTQQSFYTIDTSHESSIKNRKSLISKIKDANVLNMKHLSKEMYDYVMNRYSSLRKTLNLMLCLHRWLPKRCIGTSKTNDTRENVLFNLFLKLCKTSQFYYIKPNDMRNIQNTKIVVSKHGVVCIVSRRINPKIPKMYRDHYLVPFVPTDDETFMRKLIFHAHNVTSDEPFIHQLHRNNVQTKAQVLFGTYSTYAHNLTMKIRSTLKNCLICNKVRCKAYKTPPSALRYFRTVDSISIHAFSSLDILGPVYLKPGKNTKAKSTKNFICVALCLKSYHTVAYLMDDMSTNSIRGVIIKLQANYSPTKYILGDSAGCFQALKSDDSIFGGRKVVIETAAPDSQLLNQVEGTAIRHLKYLIHSAFGTTMANNKFPKMTWFQADLLLNICTSTFNLRCIISPKTNNEQDSHLYLSPYLIKMSYLGKIEQDQGVKNALMSLSEDQESLWDLVSENEKFKDHLKSELRHYMFANVKDFIQHKTNNFQFQFADFVLLRRGGHEKSTKYFKLGQIEKLNKEKTYVEVRTLRRGKRDVTKAHVSVLIFLHRSQNEIKKLSSQIKEQDRILKWKEESINYEDDT